MTTNTKSDFKKSISREVEKILEKNRDADKWGEERQWPFFQVLFPRVFEQLVTFRLTTKPREYHASISVQRAPEV